MNKTRESDEYDQAKVLKRLKDYISINYEKMNKTKKELALENLKYYLWGLATVPTMIVITYIARKCLDNS